MIGPAIRRAARIAALGIGFAVAVVVTLWAMPL